MRRRGSSARWLREHRGDPYVKEAVARGYRSRAAFKLLEIDDRERLLRRGLTVVDLGAAPGGWSQVARERVGAQGRVLAIDILPMDPLPGVECIQGDFREAPVLEALREALGGTPVGLVMSDMAPNISGVRTVDQLRAIHLAELALDLGREVLAAGGNLLVKVFQGEGQEGFARALRASFAKVSVRKPRASRARSRELYLVARGFRL